MNIPSEHHSALTWFQQRAGQILTWQELESGPCVLTISAKGIYKPKSSPYALSIRQSLGSPYSDEEPEYQPDGSWIYRYAEEEQNGRDPKDLFTNQGLDACRQDGIPIAVLRQVSSTPNTRYHLLGLAKVIEWKDGFFTVRSTTLDLETSFSQVNETIVMSVQQHFTPYAPENVEDCRKRVIREITARQGQASFRSGLLTAYQGRCAISGCQISEVLEAAHITPYLGPETNCVTNGLLLRSDLHTLWDKGLIYVDDQLRLNLLESLMGSEYIQFHMKKIFTPTNESLKPSIAALRQHREWCTN